MLRRLSWQNRATRGHKSELEARIGSYELAYRMQSAAPEAVELSRESEATRRLYGFGNRDTEPLGRCCLLARRMVERGVRFVQLFHEAWDQHGNLKAGVAANCKTTDQATAALVKELKERGLLDDTLVVWGGEFGRTIYCQGKLTRQKYGRDHHPNCFTYWLAGGGVKGGITYGETDDYSVNVTENPVHVHDLQATILHQLGINHERLTHRYQGRYFRLTDVHGNVVEQILA